MNKFEELVETVLAGGFDSAFGSGVGSTASSFSGDNYAPGDARIPKSIFGGVVTRNGLKGGKTRKPRKRKRKKK